MAKAKTDQSSVEVSELTKSLVEAIQLTRPEAKKTITTRKKATPWTPTDGSPKLKLKRKMYHHGLVIDQDRLSNEEISLLNQIKPGTYCNGWVKVIRRKDRGLDIDYPVKTAAQRLRLVSDHRVHSFTSLLEKLISEGKNPKKIESEEVED